MRDSGDCLPAPSQAASASRLLAVAILSTALSVKAGSAELGSPPTLEQLQRRIADLVDSSYGAGVGIALVDTSGPIWVGGVGVVDRVSRRPVTGETLFRAASLAKSMTALALMQLEEQGLLSIEARLREIAPEVEFDNPWEATHPIRVANVLEHTAGFDESHFNEQWEDHSFPRPLGELLAINRAARRARWPPGTRMSYSNENYLVAGYLIEKVTGRRYEDVVRDQIFSPLGMRSASFWRTPESVPYFAQGHQGARPVPDEQQIIRPAVNLIASPQDLSRYLTFWLGRGRVADRRLLSSKSIDRIESCRTLPYAGPEQRYGLGNDADQFEGYVGRGHTGIYDGYIASFRYFPREGVGWALLFNSDGMAMRFAVEREVLHFLMRGEPARAPATLEMPVDAMRGFLGTYRNASPQIEIFSFASLFEGMQVGKDDSGFFERNYRQDGLFRRVLQAPRQPLIATGLRAFRHPDEAVSSRLFVHTQNGGEALITPNGYLEWTPALLFQMERFLFFAALACLLTAPFFSLFWLPGSVLRPHRRPANLSARIFPLLASLTFFSVYQLLLRSPQRWGRVNATTVAAFVLTLAFAAFAAAGLVCALRAPTRTVGVAVKLHSLLVAASAAGLTLYFWKAHWIGIRLWAW
jgi:CubicO group peptidase (beta-lactamase class C family)